MRRPWWITLVALGTGVSGYAAAVLLLPNFGAPFVTGLKAHLAIPLWMHLGGGPVALATGAWQLHPELRARALWLQSWLCWVPNLLVVEKFVIPSSRAVPIGFAGSPGGSGR